MSIEELPGKLFNRLTELPVRLDVHARNFLYIADDFAEIAPAAGRKFLEAGQEINRLDGGSRHFLDRYLEVNICKALRDDSCLLKIAQESETAMSRDASYFFQIAAIPYAMAGDFASVRRLMPSTAPKHCSRGVYPAIAERLAQDGDLSAIPGWLRDWARCQMNQDPIYRHFSGFAVNRWGGIAQIYARLSHWQSDAGSYGAALNSAKMALLLALETERTWGIEDDFYRAKGFADAYGSALGALVRVEAGVSAGR